MYKRQVEGKAVKVEGMTAKSGKSFDATLQVNAEKKGIEFIFNNKQGLKERQQHSQQQGAPHKLCGLELSDKQREASVSYTHLDVYKRQVLVCFASFGSVIFSKFAQFTISI